MFDAEGNALPAITVFDRYVRGIPVKHAAALRRLPLPHLRRCRR